MSDEFVPISDIIRFRLMRNGVPFKANDNIAEHINDYEIGLLEAELTERFEEVLKALIIDTDNDPNSKGTAHRLAKTYLYELFRGRYTTKPVATAFPNDDEVLTYSGMIVVRAELRSMCAHHHQSMEGVAYIGIIPDKKVLGLSKYIRIAQWVARRGQIQEQLCVQIANEIQKEIDTADIGVYVSMTHGCVEIRGVQAHSSLTQTTVLRGLFDRDLGTKEEFMKNVHLQEMFATRPK